MRGTGALIELLRNNLDGMESGRYAAFTLSNLTTIANHKQQIVDGGSIDFLICLACSMDANAQWQAFATLRGICIDPKFRTKAIEREF